ncbi:hypothetical protein ACHAPT_004524 [Fusarium lateritium]
MSGGENDQTGVVSDTPDNAFRLDVEQHQSTQGIASSSGVQDVDEDNESHVAKSTQDEFADVRFIPDTPPPTDSNTLETAAGGEGEGENPEVDGRLVATQHRRTKRKRMESILSDGDEEVLPSEGMTSYRDVEGTEVRQNTSPTRQRTDTTEPCHETKFKPLPRGAPRIIEKKGKYTIRKGIRIRDYKVPSPDSSWYLPPPSSPEFQCRDGFDANEASMGYPQPMNPRVQEMGGLVPASLDLDQYPKGLEEMGVNQPEVHRSGQQEGDESAVDLISPVHITRSM